MTVTLSWKIKEPNRRLAFGIELNLTCSPAMTLRRYYEWPDSSQVRCTSVASAAGGVVRIIDEWQRFRVVLRRTVPATYGLRRLKPSPNPRMDSSGPIKVPPFCVLSMDLLPVCLSDWRPGWRLPNCKAPAGDPRVNGREQDASWRAGEGGCNDDALQGDCADSDAIGEWALGHHLDRSIQRPTDFRAHHSSLPALPLCPFCPGNEAQTPPKFWRNRDAGASATQSRLNIRLFRTSFRPSD